LSRDFRSMAASAALGVGGGGDPPDSPWETDSGVNPIYGIQHWTTHPGLVLKGFLVTNGKGIRVLPFPEQGGTLRSSRSYWSWCKNCSYGVLSRYLRIGLRGMVFRYA